MDTSRMIGPGQDRSAPPEKGMGHTSFQRRNKMRPPMSEWRRRPIRTALIGATALVASLLFAPAATAGAVSGAAVQPAALDVSAMPYMDASLPVDQRVADLMGRMTLVEKIGQMTQAERGAVSGNPNLIAQQNLGSVLS